jgi:AraC-like DNA-binding protein
MFTSLRSIARQPSWFRPPGLSTSTLLPLYGVDARSVRRFRIVPGVLRIELGSLRIGEATVRRSWVGDVVLGPGWLRYSGLVTSTDRHAHHAVQVIDAAEPVTIIGNDDEAVTTDRAIIPADREHQLKASGQHAVMTYLEPSLVIVHSGHRPAEWAGGARSLGPRSTNMPAEDHVGALLLRIGSPVGTVDDDLVTAAAAEVRRRLPGPIRLTEVAAALAISPSRLTHRFTAGEGIPLGRWVLWERLRLAAIAIASSSDLTAAAHAAGFADSSHLHRTFRRMFGIAPSQLSRVARWSVHG